MNLEQRTRALLALVDAYRRQRHDEVVAPAQAHARALVKAARSEARQRVHKAVTEARERVTVEVAAAEAALQNQRRLYAQRRALVELGLAWRALRQALLARWRSLPRRAAWVARQVQSARVLLPVDNWEIEHAPDWAQPEREQTLSQLRAQGIAVVRCTPDTTVAAGLRIRAGRNVLDATLDGLLADRAALESRLLRALTPSPSPTGVREGRSSSPLPLGRGAGGKQ